MSHTPGPWEIGQQNGTHPDEGLVGILGPQKENSRGVPIRLYVAQYVDKKDADLIAAAPDLLLLLQESVSTLADTRRPIEDWLNEARATIRKATGVQQ